MNRARKVDTNQPEIVAVLRAAGYTVALTHRNGDGFPDICVGIETQSGHRYNALMEIKRPGENLNEREADWHAGWGGQVAIVRSADEALGICEMIQEKM
jgi:hypothetical protein